MAANRAVIHSVVEVGWIGPYSAGQSSVQFLINRIVIVGIELPHVVAIHNVDVGILARSHRQMMHLAVVVLEVGQQDRATGAEVLIAVRFLHRVVHVEVVGDRELRRSGKLHERVSIVSIDGKALCH